MLPAFSIAEFRLTQYAYIRYAPVREAANAWASQQKPGAGEDKLIARFARRATRRGRFLNDAWSVGDTISR